MSEAKENRLRRLARIAGGHFLNAYLSGHQERAIHFNEKRKRILRLIWQPTKGN